jgi:transcriptional regulator with XRE-family HTH domain
MRIENKLNEWFEEKRKEEGLNKEQQAEKIGISLSLLSHYANGTREPSKKFLRKVVEAYNLKGDEEKDLYIASLTDVEIEKAESGKEMTPEELLVYVKYGIR